jgi:GT2 family glycosyltransferase
MRKSITAIVPSFRRHENISIIVQRLQHQTRPPERIIIWNDNAGDYGQNVATVPSVEVINTNSNWWSNYGAFLIGYLTNTDFISIVDDDTPPGPEWFAYCLKHQRTLPGLYGQYGVVMNGRQYRDCIRYNANQGNDEFAQVDMVGNSYFVPAKAINCMLYEKPPAFAHTCDLHLSYCAQKYGGFRCYVPHPSAPKALPCYEAQELAFNRSERAMYNDPDHWLNRDRYVKWAVRNGWKLLLDRALTSKLMPKEPRR